MAVNYYILKMIQKQLFKPFWEISEYFIYRLFKLLQANPEGFDSE